MPFSQKEEGAEPQSWLSVAFPSRGKQAAMKDTLEGGQLKPTGGRKWVGHLWRLCPDAKPRKTDLKLGSRAGWGLGREMPRRIPEKKSH